MTFNFVPKGCPGCGADLEWRNHDLYCPNRDCPAKDSSILMHWLSSMGRRDMLGVGDCLLDAVVDYYGWKSVYDIYCSPPQEGSWAGMIKMDGMGESKLQLVGQTIRNLTKTPVAFPIFLEALGIKGIGYKIARILDRDTNLRQCLEEDTRQNLNIAQAKGLGESILQAVLDNWAYMHNMYIHTWEMLQDCSDREAQAVPAEGKLKVCITGKANDGLTRKQFYDRYADSIEEASIASCDYLVCNQPSNSSKIKTAKAKGIKVITEDELKALL